MPVIFLCIFRFFRLLMSSHGAIAMENAALRVQLAAFQRKRQRPMLTAFDRLFWVGLSLIWNGWRAALRYVQPDTVVRWQRERFRKFWARLSRGNRRRRGRPATAVEIRRLIERIVAANPLWRAPRVHGELMMLGIEISERTVCRMLRTLRRPPTQTWKTFLHNPSFAKIASVAMSLRCDAFITVMKTELRDCDNLADTRDLPREWTLLVEPQMGSGPMVVTE